jgi:DNA-binding IclR family transcriptional regulator
MAFYPRNAERGTAGPSKKTEFHIATAKRGFRILAKNRFLHRNPFRRKFYLGPSIFALAEVAIEQVSGEALMAATFIS